MVLDQPLLFPLSHWISSSWLENPLCNSCPSVSQTGFAISLRRFGSSSQTLPSQSLVGAARWPSRFEQSRSLIHGTLGHDVGSGADCDEVTGFVVELHAGDYESFADPEGEGAGGELAAGPGAEEVGPQVDGAQPGRGLGPVACLRCLGENAEKGGEAPPTVSSTEEMTPPWRMFLAGSPTNSSRIPSCIKTRSSSTAVSCRPSHRPKGTWSSTVSIAVESVSETLPGVSPSRLTVPPVAFGQ